MRAVAFAFVAAAVLGLALGALLTGTGPGASGIGGGEFWTLVLIFASAFLGWQAAQVSPVPASLGLAPAMVVVMVAALLAVKFNRLPSAPLVGDGFQILVGIYAAVGLLGALIGRIPSLRARTATGAVRAGLWLSAAALVVSLAAYGWAASAGS